MYKIILAFFLTFLITFIIITITQNTIIEYLTYSVILYFLFYFFIHGIVTGYFTSVTENINHYSLYSIQYTACYGFKIQYKDKNKKLVINKDKNKVFFIVNNTKNKILKVTEKTLLINKNSNWFLKKKDKTIKTHFVSKSDNVYIYFNRREYKKYKERFPDYF